MWALRANSCCRGWLPFEKGFSFVIEDKLGEPFLAQITVCSVVSNLLGEVLEGRVGVESVPSDYHQMG